MSGGGAYNVATNNSIDSSTLISSPKLTTTPIRAVASVVATDESSEGASAAFNRRQQPPERTAAAIVHLNVGGQRFSTARSTLSWIPDTFFTSLLSGRIPSVEDGSGAIFIDRDPELFRRILNYLRTKQIDLSNINPSMLKHEAEFYGLAPLVKRLTLCEEMERSPCGDILFHAYIPPPVPSQSLTAAAPLSDDGGGAATEKGTERICTRLPPTTRGGSLSSEMEAVSNSGSVGRRRLPVRESHNNEQHQSTEARNSLSKFSPSASIAADNHPTSSQTSSPSSFALNSSSENGSGSNGSSNNSSSSPPLPASFIANPLAYKPTHSKKNSCDFTKQIRNELSNLLRQSERTARQDASMRVRIIRAHHNSLAVAYYNFVCCYRMKDSMGWQPIYTSPRMDHPIGHIALVSKFGTQLSEKMLAVSLADNSVHLWCLDENNESESNRKLGTFTLAAQIDKLFFIGNQLVALSKSGKVGIWHSMTMNWQVQDVFRISCCDTAGSVLLLGCANGSIYYFDMQKFPLRMKDNDLLITELYRDPNADVITAISVYLTPKTNLCGNWIEIAYGTHTGCVRVIVQHPETVGHGPQLFQTFTVHTAPITRVALTTAHLISVCSEYNHVRSWSVTRFRGMISTQPGGASLASFKVLTLDPAAVDENLRLSEGCDPGPYGEQDGEQLFVQRLVPDTNALFVRLASSGERICTIRSVDGSPIVSFFVHECDGSNRMGARPRRYLFTGVENGSIQMWDLTTALDHYNVQRLGIGGAFGVGGGAGSGPEKSPSAGGSSAGSSSAAASAAISGAIGAGGGGASSGFASLITGGVNYFHSSSSFMGGARHLLLCTASGLGLQGPTPEELLEAIDECELCTASLSATPASLTPQASALNISGAAHNGGGGASTSSADADMGGG